MSKQQFPSFGFGLLVGAIVGGAIALLFAPRSGKVNRAYLRRRMYRLTHQVDGKQMSGDGHAVIRSQD